MEIPNVYVYRTLLNRGNKKMAGVTPEEELINLSLQYGINYCTVASGFHCPSVQPCFTMVLMTCGSLANDAYSAAEGGQAWSSWPGLLKRS